MKNRFLILISLITLVFIGSLQGQETTKTKRIKNLGVALYGELGFRPGVSVDLNVFLMQRSTRRLRQYLYFRPTIVLFHRPYYSNNFMIYPQLISRSIVLSTDTHTFYTEIKGLVGYQREQFIGDTYTSSSNGIIESSGRGENILVYGIGASFGAVALDRSREYFLSFDFNKLNTPTLRRVTQLGLTLGMRLELEKGSKQKKTRA